MSEQIHRTNIQVRFSDTDALGHVNNAIFATWAELGRLEFLHSLGGTVRSLILASLTIEFRRQVMFDEPVSVESWIPRIGNSSFGLDQIIYAGGEVVAEITSTIVHFDYSINKASRVPDSLRSAMGDYLRAG